MNEPDQTVWMSLKEVTVFLECSKGFVLKQAANGLIKRRTTSAHKRYRRSDVEALAARQAQAAS